MIDTNFKCDTNTIFLCDELKGSEYLPCGKWSKKTLGLHEVGVICELLKIRINRELIMSSQKLVNCISSSKFPMNYISSSQFTKHCELNLKFTKNFELNVESTKHWELLIIKVTRNCDLENEFTRYCELC